MMVVVGDGPILTCGHGDSGDWDKGSYVNGQGRPIKHDEFNSSQRIADLEAELKRLKGEI